MMNMTDKCRLIIDYIIYKTYQYNLNKEFLEQITMNMNRIQRLLYLIQLEYMYHFKEAIIDDEFYAWPSGPAIPEIYDIYENLVANASFNPIKRTLIRKIPEQMQAVLDYVLERTNNIDTLDLVNISKVNNSPWYNVYNPDDENHIQIVPKNEISQYSKTVNPLTEFWGCCNNKKLVKQL